MSNAGGCKQDAGGDVGDDATESDGNSEDR